MPAVTRLGDKCTGDTHKTSPKTPAPSITSSEDVFVNELGAIRVGDQYDAGVHKVSVPPKLQGGSPDVFVNDKALGRLKDPLDCGDTVMEASPDTFAND